MVGIVQAGQDSSLYSVERPLAASQQVYMVIDPKERVIWIKARGVPVRKFTTYAIKLVGDPIGQPAVYTVLRKNPPIEPPTTVAASPDQRRTQGLPMPMTVSDMPTHFEIVLEGGLSLVIQSIRTTSVFRENWDRVEGWISRMYASMATWSQGMWGKNASVLVLEMGPTEAQGLYWALVPSTRIILQP